MRSAFAPSSLLHLLLLLLRLGTCSTESLQIRSESPRLIEVVARHWTTAAMMLKRKRAQPVELAGKFADLPLQLLVRSAEAVALQLNGLHLLSLPRAAIGSRHLVSLSESLHFAFGGRRAG